MSRLQELIEKLCPNGVEYKKLGEVCKMERGSSVTKASITVGDVPVIAGGQKPAYYCSGCNRNGETICVAGSGAYAGFVSYWNIPIFVSDAFSIKGGDKCLTKYIYYILSNIQNAIYSKKKGAGVPHVHVKDLAKIEIPVPPMEVQEEIVRILDKFTRLTAELQADLQADLQARREQYEYYRNQLLNFKGGGTQSVSWKKMSEVGEIGTGSSNRQDALEQGAYPFFVRSKTILRKNAYEYDDEAIIIPGEGGIGEIFHYVKGKYALHQRAYRVHIMKEDIVTKFVYYYMAANFKSFIQSRAVNATVTSIRKPMLEQFPIPIPPIELQEKIVGILDRFEALVSDLSRGLPAEIEAVGKQYEYYRNRLLTFKRLDQDYGRAD